MRHACTVLWAMAWVVLAMGLARCDAVEPEADDLLVVEAFFDAGEPLPAIRLRQAGPLSEPYVDRAAEGAEVVVYLGETAIAYAPVSGESGRYVAAEPRVADERQALRFEAQWRDQHARAESFIPPAIDIDSLHLEMPEAPVEAVLLDSLTLDSLSISVEQGFIYPVEVTLWWTSAFEETAADSAYWIQTRLRPFTSFSSTVVDFFLRPEQVFRERALGRGADGTRRWTGVYAIPVETAETPLPDHRLNVSLVRSRQDYARFAASRGSPEQREPISNVEGAIGIVAGISVDSVQVDVRAGMTAWTVDRN